MTCFMFFMQEYDSFTQLRLTTWRSLWLGGKCLSMSCKNFFPTFVLTPALNGGLNQTTFLFFNFLTNFLIFLLSLSFSFSSSYISVCLCPLLSSAFWYSGAAFLNSSAELEMLESLLLTDSGTAFFTVLGWLDPMWR